MDGIAVVPDQTRATTRPSRLRGYALLVDFFSRDQPIADGVYVFESEHDVYEFAAETLCRAGEMSKVNGQFVLDDGSAFSTSESAIDEYADTLEMQQYFHIREWREPTPDCCTREVL